MGGNGKGQVSEHDVGHGKNHAGGAQLPPGETDYTIAMRAGVSECLKHAQAIPTLKLMPGKDQVNGMLDNQNVILRSLAFLMDAQVHAKTGRHELQVKVGKASAILVPAAGR